MIKIDGFEIINVVTSPIVVGNSNGAGYNNTYVSAARQIEISNIYAHQWQAGSGNYSNGFQSNGSAWLVHIHDCISDMSAYSAGYDYSNLFIYGNQGDCRYWLIERCVFIGNGNSGQVIELQGAANSPSTVVTNENIRLIDCVIVSGASSGAPLAGSGGAYIDDTNGGSNAYITNVTFEDCQWINTGLTYLPYKSLFGYVRFINGAAGAFSGTLTGRSPGQSVSIKPSTGTFNYTNNDGFDEDVIVSGGTVSAIYIDSIVTGLTTGSFMLKPLHEISVTNTSVPAMTKIAA
jgi:hypothetical protein